MKKNIYTCSVHWKKKNLKEKVHFIVKGKLRDFFYMLAKYVPGDIKYIFTKFYRHIFTSNEANRKFVILISNFSIGL